MALFQYNSKEKEDSGFPFFPKCRRPTTWKRNYIDTNSARVTYICVQLNIIQQIYQTNYFAVVSKRLAKYQT